MAQTTTQDQTSSFVIPGQILVIMAAMLWGTTGTTQALAPEGATPEVLGALRLVIGGAVLVIFAVLKGSLRPDFRLPLRPYLIATVMIAAYQLFFFAGVGRTGVAVGTIVGIGSAPILAGALDVLVERHPLRRRWVIATGVALVGCALLLLPGGNITVDPLGVLLAMGAGASYAIYTLASKYLLATESSAPRDPDAAPHPRIERDSDAVMAVVFASGGVLLLPMLFMVDVSWIATPGGMVVAVHLGFIATGLSYMLFGRGLRTVTAATAVTLTLAEPLTAGVLGVVLVGERLTLIAALGIVLLFIGLAILTVKPPASTGHKSE